MEKRSVADYLHRPRPGALVFAFLVTLSSLLCNSSVTLAAQKPLSHGNFASKLDEQRHHYQAAKTALRQNNIDKFQRHYAQLGDYPLKPYLDYSQLSKDLHKLEFDKIDHFLTVHQNSYLEARLRKQVLHILSVRKRWNDFLKYYDAARYNGKDMQCQWLYARLRKNDTTALAPITELWVEGKSLPDACDPLIASWRRKGHLSQELIWERFTAAMDKRNKGLARYLRGFMDKRYKHYAELMLQLDAYPQRISKHRDYSETSLPMQQVIAHGIKRYARSAPEKALYQWELYEAQQLFPEQLAKLTKLEIIRQLTFDGHTDAVEKLISQSPSLQENSVIENFVRESLRQGDWTRVLSWLDFLDEKARFSNRWQYWRARAMQELRLVPVDGKKAETIYQELATERSFYGFLAADIIGSGYSLQFQPVELSSNNLSSIANLPGMRRAKELWLTDNRSQAQAEWAYSVQDMNREDLVAAGELAKGWGWYNSGIRAMIKGNLWDHLSIRFPLAYEPLVRQAAGDTNIQPNLIFAIARQESAFAEKARSSAGAMGLMQVMPSTARATAKRNGIKHHKNDLLDPEHNILIGSRYLNQLLEQFNGNRILAAAAYNAGPHRVDRWLRSAPQDMAFDVWIETIPFRETRGYVQNVLAFSVIYGYRMGSPTSLVTESEAKSLL